MCVDEENTSQCWCEARSLKHKSTYRIKLRVLAAANLQVQNGCPVVVIKCEGHEQHTNIGEGNRPNWDETFEFRPREQPTEVWLTCYNHLDALRKDPLGYARIPLNSANWGTGWHKLVRGGGVAGGGRETSAGAVKVQIF
jgi:hypothetical protein